MIRFAPRVRFRHEWRDYQQRVVDELESRLGDRFKADLAGDSSCDEGWFLALSGMAALLVLYLPMLNV